MNRLAPVAELQRIVAHLCDQPARIMTNRETCLAAVHARQVAMYLAVNHLGKSKSEVGRRFNVDRTTVRWALIRVRQKDALMQKVTEAMALIGPVDNGEETATSKNLADVCGRTETEQTQEERLAA